MKKGNDLQKEAEGAAKIIGKYLNGSINDIDEVKKANKIIKQYITQRNKKNREIGKNIALYKKLKKQPGKEKESAALFKKINEDMRK